jgi:hypothetical protein
MRLFFAAAARGVLAPLSSSPRPTARVDAQIVSATAGAVPVVPNSGINISQSVLQQ